MAYKVPIPNAYSINRLGFTGSYFPLSIEFYQSQNIFALYIYPLRVIDICDILAGFGISLLTVFDVNHLIYSALDNNPLSISRVASDRKINHQTIDMETIIVTIEGFKELLTDLGHYDLHAFDISQIWQEINIIESVITINEHNFALADNKFILPKLKNTNIYIDSHDDCYIYFEAFNRDLLKRVISRIIQSFVGTILYEEYNLENDINDIPTTLLDTYFLETPAITILRENCSYFDNELKIGISRKKNSLREPNIYPIDSLITYNPLTGKWQE